MYLTTSSSTNGVYTPPKYPGDLGRYKEVSKTETTDEKKPSLPELKETLTKEEDDLNALLGTFQNRMDRLNELTGSNYRLGSVIDYTV